MITDETRIKELKRIIREHRKVFRKIIKDHTGNSTSLDCSICNIAREALKRR